MVFITVSLVILLLPSGETEHNRLRILQGQSDVPLSDVGLHQAVLVAKRLAREEESWGGFDTVFSSDLCRATQVRLTGVVIVKVALGLVPVMTSVKSAKLEI